MRNYRELLGYYLKYSLQQKLNFQTDVIHVSRNRKRHNRLRTCRFASIREANWVLCKFSLRRHIFSFRKIEKKFKWKEPLHLPKKLSIILHREWKEESPSDPMLLFACGSFFSTCALTRCSKIGKKSGFVVSHMLLKSWYV